MYYFLPRLIRKPVNPPPGNREFAVFAFFLHLHSVHPSLGLNKRRHLNIGLNEVWNQN
jgi:hypothetical protein